MADEPVTRPADPSRADGAGRCVDPERLAAFIDRRLPAGERASVEAHLAACRDCREVLAETIRFQREERGSAVARFGGWRPKVVAAAAVLAVAAVAVLAVRVERPAWFARGAGRSGDRPELAALVAAVGARRPIEPRLTGGFAYGPPPSPMRGGTAPEIDPDVRIAAAEIEKRMHAHETPLTENALGVADLVTGDVDRGIPLLEDAADQQAGNGEFQSDLAAAYLVAASRFDRAEDYPRALAAAERAIKADPSLAEAWFNRALALEALSLTDEARQAWQDYLKRDATSKWADEARKHLAALPADDHKSAWDPVRPTLLAALDANDSASIRGIVDRFGQETREAVENDFLPAWGDAVVAGDGVAATRWLTRAERLATVIAAEHHDRLPIAAVRRARAVAGRPNAARQLAEGYRTYRKALQQYGQDQFEEAGASFAVANAKFVATGSPSALWTRFWLGVARYQRADYASARSIFRALRGSAQRRHCDNLLGRADWAIGLIDAIGNRLASSLASYREAAKSFGRTGELGNLTTLEELTAETETLEGATSLGWAERLSALRNASNLPDARLRHVVYGEVMRESLHEGLPEAALHFQNAVMREMTHWATPNVETEEFLARAQIESRLQNSPDADADLRAAEQALKGVTGSESRVAMGADLALERATLDGQTDPDAALGDLGTVIADVKKSGQLYLLPGLTVTEAAAYRRSGDPQSAERALLDGIDVFEHARLPAGVDQQADYLNQSWALFSGLSALEAADGHADRALAAVELGHAPPSPGHGLAWAGSLIDQATSMLPPGAVMIYYVSLDDRLLGWVLSPGHRRMFSSPIRRTELSRLVHLFTISIDESGGDQVFKNAAAALYDDLIRPAGPEILQAHRLIIVPGDVLAPLPFSALLERRSGRFLVEDYAIGMVPSAVAFIKAAGDWNADRSLRSMRVLAVGNPAIDRSVFPDLPALPGAAIEAEAVTQVFPDADLLLGSAATKRRFLQLAGRAEIVHFGGHAIVNPDHPLLSQLIFAPSAAQSPDDDGALRVGEIEKLRWPATKLIVLAACGSASGADYRGEGVLSVARAWLDTGVPSVVATLWDVSDQVSQDLFAHYYDALRRTGDPIGALRRAQLALMSSPRGEFRRPQAWAAFAGFGWAPPDGSLLSWKRIQRQSGKETR